MPRDDVGTSSEGTLVPSGHVSSRNLFPTQSWVWLNSTVPFSAAKTIMINSAQHCSQQQQHQRVYSFPHHTAVCNCSSLCVVLSRGSLGLYTSDVHVQVNTLLYKISDMQIMLQDLEIQSDTSYVAKNKSDNCPLTKNKHENLILINNLKDAECLRNIVYPSIYIIAFVFPHMPQTPDTLFLLHSQGCVNRISSTWTE